MLLKVNNIKHWFTYPMSGVLLGDFQLSTISGKVVIKQFMNGLINSEFNYFSYQFPYSLIAQSEDQVQDDHEHKRNVESKVRRHVIVKGLASHLLVATKY